MVTSLSALGRQDFYVLGPFNYVHVLLDRQYHCSAVRKGYDRLPWLVTLAGQYGYGELLATAIAL